MKIKLNLSDTHYEELIAHLLPEQSKREEAAFIFADFATKENTTTLNVISVHLASHLDFIHQDGTYLHLTDKTRAALIKRAHDLGACLIEMHSHPGPWPARFSTYDNEGLREIVPHMKWRLPKRPYAAIVVAPSGFDALVWLDSPDAPVVLDALVTPARAIRPTNLSIRDWA